MTKIKNVKRNGNLGVEILRRFHVTIDYSRQQLILKPNFHYRQAFDHDMFGVEIEAFGTAYKRFLIAVVEPGSPAAEAGILPQDEILFINGSDAKQLSMTKIDRLFK